MSQAEGSAAAESWGRNGLGVVLEYLTLSVHRRVLTGLRGSGCTGASEDRAEYGILIRGYHLASGNCPHSHNQTPLVMPCSVLGSSQEGQGPWLSALSLMAVPSRPPFRSQLAFLSYLGLSLLHQASLLHPHPLPWFFQPQGIALLLRRGGHPALEFPVVNSSSSFKPHGSPPTVHGPHGSTYRPLFWTSLSSTGLAVSLTTWVFLKDRDFVQPPSLYWHPAQARQWEVPLEGSGRPEWIEDMTRALHPWPHVRIPRSFLK